MGGEREGCGRPPGGQLALAVLDDDDDAAAAAVGGRRGAGGVAAAAAAAAARRGVHGPLAMPARRQRHGLAAPAGSVISGRTQPGDTVRGWARPAWR